MRIVHIATESDWAAACASGVYRTSTLGASIDEVGYIHASWPDQLPATAAAYYAGVTAPLVVLVLDTERLRAGGVPVVVEDVDGQTFPHLYAELPVDLVDEVLPASFSSDGAFDY